MNFETLFLILQNQSIWPIKIILLYRQIKDSFRGCFLFLGYWTCIRRGSSLETDVKGFKRREKFGGENL